MTVRRQPWPLLPATSQARHRALWGGLAGLGAALLGALLWIVVTVLTHYQIGGMTVGIGWLVGITVRFFGRGTIAGFGVLGAALTLLGCLAGNLLTIGILASRQAGWTLDNLLAQQNAALVIKLLQATLHPTDVFFYGLAMYIGYRFSFQRETKVTLPKMR